MSVEFYGWGWSQDLTPTAKLVLLALCERASRTTREAWPSQANLARMTGFERRAIGKALGTLEGAGLITRERRYRDDGSRTSDRFRLHLDVTAATAVSLGDPRSRDRQTEGVRPTAARSLHQDLELRGAEPHLEPVKNPSSIPSSNPNAIDLHFDEFWSIYPRKVGRHTAFAAWRASVTEDLVAEVLAGARAYSDDQLFKDETYIKYPSRWLEERRWEDEAPTCRPRLTDIDVRNLATITQIFGGQQTHDVIDHARAGKLATPARGELVPA